MADLIDRQWLMERLGIKDDCRECKYHLGPLCSQGSEFVDACEAIMDAPSAQPEYMLRIHQDSIEFVRKKNTGRWMHHKTKSGKNWWRCSECGAVTENASAAHYCYNCGADMKGGVDGADGNG